MLVSAVDIDTSAIGTGEILLIGFRSADVLADRSWVSFYDGSSHNEARFLTANDCDTRELYF